MRKQVTPLKRIRSGCLILMAAVLFICLRGFVFRPASAYPGVHFNQGKNAAWIGVEWVNEAHDAQAIAALADDLAAKQIVYVFAYVSYLKPDGSFNQTFGHASDFIRSLKADQPGLKVLAWIGLPLGYVFLSDPKVRERVVAFASDRLNAALFDGIQYDAEPTVDGDPNFIALLDETRQAIGPRPILSIAARTTWPILPDAPWTHAFGGIFWSASYYKQLARYVDQIALMTYDSGLGQPVLYRLWTRFQVIQTSNALAGSPVELLIGVPTSEEESPSHHPAAENITSGLQGVIDGLNDYEAQPGAVTGVAIYP
ncbi:MAG TPA: glycosyl hydrolase family 18 protein, partial [Aggregatilineales bacterium]|nr:glycosyl hydrolase family 18 protein [Aggregatilineales bacterium]